MPRIVRTPSGCPTCLRYQKDEHARKLAVRRKSVSLFLLVFGTVLLVYGMILHVLGVS